MVIGASRREGFASRSLGDRRGFSLIEALVASALGAVVIALVMTVVIAQGDHFQEVAGRSERQGSVRVGAELLREELQAVTYDGITTASAAQLVFRVPLSVGMVCVGASRGRGGGNGSGYLPSPGGGISDARVSGWGYLNGDEWTYSTATLSAIAPSGGTPAATCAAAGADTVGAYKDFYSLSTSTISATSGTIIQLFTLVEYRIADSVLRPGTKALFRKEGSGSLIEYVTGLSTSSRFQYRRRGQTTFQNSVTGAGNLRIIEEVRVVLEAEGMTPGADDPATYSWDFRVALRNVTAP